MFLYTQQDLKEIVFDRTNLTLIEANQISARIVKQKIGGWHQVNVATFIGKEEAHECMLLYKSSLCLPVC